MRFLVTAPHFSSNDAFPRRQSRSRRRSHHYCPTTHYEQTSHNGAMTAPTEHQVCLILFAKNAGLKTRAGYHRCDAATAVLTEHPQDRQNTRRTAVHREVRPSKAPPARLPRRVRARRRGQFASKMRFRIANPWINRSWVNCDQMSFWFQKQERPPFKSIISR